MAFCKVEDNNEGGEEQEQPQTEKGRGLAIFIGYDDYVSQIKTLVHSQKNTQGGLKII